MHEIIEHMNTTRDPGRSIMLALQVLLPQSDLMLFFYSFHLHFML